MKANIHPLVLVGGALTVAVVMIVVVSKLASPERIADDRKPVANSPARSEPSGPRVIQSFAKIALHPQGSVVNCHDLEGVRGAKSRVCDVTFDSDVSGSFSECEVASSDSLHAFPEEALTPSFWILECAPPGGGKWFYFVGDKRLPKELSGAFLGAMQVIVAPDGDDTQMETRFESIYGKMESNPGMGRITERDPYVSTSSSSVRFCEGAVCNEGAAWMNRYSYNPQKQQLPAMRLLDVDTVLAVRKVLRAARRAEAAQQTKASVEAVQ